MNRYLETTTSEQWTLTFLRAQGCIALESAIGPDGEKITNPAKFPEHVRDFCLLEPGTDRCEGITSFDEFEECDDLKCVHKSLARRTYEAVIPYTKREQNPAFKGIKFDNYDHAIGKDGQPFTDPYGLLAWCIGSDEDFHCFDVARVAPGLVALHSAINSETGSFLMTGTYDIVPDAEAVAVAQFLIDQAFEWVYDNGVEFNQEDAERAQREFLAEVESVIAQKEVARAA
jgi:hypothetical protein